MPAFDLIKFKSASTEIETMKAESRATFEMLAPIRSVLDLDQSTMIQENFVALEAWFRERYMDLGRPLKILIDISCIPKSYLLFLVGLGFTRDYFACLDCVYAAGQYDLIRDHVVNGAPAIVGPRALVSLGDWRSTLIPYLTAAEYLPGSSDLIVAMGGEFGLSLPFIERVEPGRLDLIFIEETAPSDDRPMLESERLALKGLTSAPNATRGDYSLLDVISVANRAVNFSRAGPSAGTTAMALGSKPHALALAVASLSEAKMNVITRVPGSYTAIDVKPTGRMLFAQIEDRFDPCNYIDLP
ncbi:hypothetical protein [Nitratireductor luteus]|uniref:hypothetical protein n=1 Tax=Nitratireductor luteus TaxID=2976980 RepID=UPI002240D6F6|nr:hypothetical protein [Nitratireductor luteus]